MPPAPKQLFLLSTLVLILITIYALLEYRFDDLWQNIKQSSSCQSVTNGKHCHGNKISDEFTAKLRLNPKWWSLQGTSGTQVRATTPIDECRKKSFLVYYCGNKTCLGGLGDREKGIVTAYLMAILLQRQFAIVSEKPCLITKFLDKNEYNWFQCNNYFGPPKIVYRVGCLEQEQTYGHHMLGLTNLINVSRTERVVFIITNGICTDEIRGRSDTKKRIPWMMNLTRSEIMKKVLLKLFKPKFRLLEKLKSFRSQIKEKKRLVCSHIRMSQNPTIPNDDLRPQPNVSVVFQFLNQNFNKSNDIIYVATDSDDVKMKSKLFFGDRVLVSPYPIVHVSRFNRSRTEEACEGLFTALYEQSLLSTCDVLVLTMGGFGKTAARLRSSMYNLFCYSYKKQAVRPCRI